MAQSQRALRKARLASLIGRLDLLPLTSRFDEQQPLFLFARGLIFSSFVMEEIHLDLPRHCEIGWGQIMADDGGLSPEVDVIIYEGRPFHEWKNETMHFVIVPKQQVKTVIECCDYLRPTKHIKQHLGQITAFTPRVFLLAECSWERSGDRSEKARKSLLDIGFEQVFYLYRCYYGRNKDMNEADWYRFLDIIRSI